MSDIYKEKIRILTVEESVKIHLPKVYEILTTKYAGWKYAGPYCPGKAGHHTFRLTQGEQTMFVHFDDRDFTVTENLV